MSTPFDFVKAISETKQNLFHNDPQADKDYIPYIVNRSLSYYVDTLFYANQMNMYNSLPNDMQFQYLLNTVAKGKRYSKWSKPDKETKSLSLVKEYFKYSDEKAKQALTVLSDDDLAIIETKLFKGGR